MFQFNLAILVFMVTWKACPETSWSEPPNITTLAVDHFEFEIHLCPVEFLGKTHLFLVVEHQTRNQEVLGSIPTQIVVSLSKTH